jgi:hypothetical protein
MALAYNATIRSAMLDTITSAAGGSATIKIYDGTRPATGGAATTLLVTLTCNATFAGAASGGVLTLNAITSGTAVATGNPTWFRLATSGGTFVLDGNCGASGSDLNLGASTINSGQTVAISSFQITEGNA